MLQKRHNRKKLENKVKKVYLQECTVQNRVNSWHIVAMQKRNKFRHRYLWYLLPKMAINSSSSIGDSRMSVVP